MTNPTLEPLNRDPESLTLNPKSLITIPKSQIFNSKSYIFNLNRGKKHVYSNWPIPLTCILSVYSQTLHHCP